jgi:hypothetical protein
LERSIEHIVIAYCEDYERREKVLAERGADEETRDFYSYLNDTIDAALDTSLSTLDRPGRVAMRQDIACRRGATYSPLYELSPATYKRYKRRAKYSIARDLGLIPLP